ncbi:MAG: RNA pseudouridine synthase [Acetobacteraceae bacterium]|nr:RNA pseudouridine synthase [Acetobacteraceae bacterium]
MNKPAGLPSHPGPRGGASVESFFPSLSRRPAGPWLVHRLDTDTAGCLLVALRHAALLAAQAEFAAGRAGKVYWAVVRGRPEADSGVLDTPLIRRSGPGGWRMVIDAAGGRALTDWTVLGEAPGLAWLELRPRTGRTHQIRVQCAEALGCPIAGDAVYGGGGPGPLHLLARALSLALTPPVAATAPPPPHMRAALGGCGWRPADGGGQDGGQVLHLPRLHGQNSREPDAAKPDAFRRERGR